MTVHGAARLKALLLWAPFLLLTCAPVAWLVARSFFPEGGELSLEAYERILGASEGAAARRATLWNSLELGALVVAATLLAGVPFGFLVARTDLRLRRCYEALLAVPLLLPPYMAGIAWVQLVSMRGLWAIVFVLASSLFPVVALLSARAFREIDADVEDAGRLLLGERRALLRVTLPLARGAIVAAALLVFVFAISDFVVADFFTFAVQNERTFQVFATVVYEAFMRQVDPITATATAVPLAAISAVVLLLLARSERARSLASLGGSHVSPRAFRLGAAHAPAHLFVVAVLAVTAVGPIAGLVKMTVRKPGPAPVVTAPAPPASAANSPTSASASGPGADEAGAVKPQAPPPTVDLSIYRQRSPVASALQRYVPDVLRSLRNAAVAGGLLLLAAFGPARALASARRGRYAQRALVLLPLAFPSLLIGMAYEQLFLGASSLSDRIHRGWGLVSLTLASRFLPVAVIGLAATWSRLAPEIEESARLAPVGAARRFARISLPLLLPGAAAVFVLGFGLAMREFDAIVLLPGSQEMLTSRIYSLVHWAQDAVVGSLALLQVASVLVPWLALRLLLGGRRP